MLLELKDHRLTPIMSRESKDFKGRRKSALPDSASSIPMKFCYNQIISKGRELSNNERNLKSKDDSKQLMVFGN
jgi:hypothetical protein